MMRLALVLLLPVMVAAMTVACGEAARENVRQEIAEAYGIGGFEEILSLRFTFNVQAGETKLSRTWIWSPSKDSVTFIRADGTRMRYVRRELTEASPDSLRQVDTWFVNDQYWLLFPLHLAWDTDANVEALPGVHSLPIGAGVAKKVVVSYPSVGGYTPGDVYDLFVDENNTLVEWVYHRGGEPEPSRAATWEDHQRFGPLRISLTHRGRDGSFRVWFTDVTVQQAY